VLAEEYGRWPEDPSLLAVKMVDLNRENNKVVNGRIPIKFVGRGEVSETVEAYGNRITVEWPDLEAGMEAGLQITAAFALNLPPPTFVRHSTSSSEEENVSISSEHNDSIDPTCG